MIPRPVRPPTGVRSASPAPSDFSAVSRYGSMSAESDGMQMHAYPVRPGLPPGEGAGAATPSRHYAALRSFLQPMLSKGAVNVQTSQAREKLIRLTPGQFQELSTDVYDELNRLLGNTGHVHVAYLEPQPSYHPKRNQARKKLSTLQAERFRDLCRDVYYELERRFPTLGSTPLPRVRADSRSRGGNYRHDMRQPSPSFARQDVLMPNKSTAVLEDVSSPMSSNDGPLSPQAEVPRDPTLAERQRDELQTQYDAARERIQVLEADLASALKDSTDRPEARELELLREENSRCKSEMEQQRKVTEEVRQEAQKLLEEMREIANREEERASEYASTLDENERLKREISQLKQDLARTRAARDLRPMYASEGARIIEPELKSTLPRGVIAIHNVLRFQMAIEEMVRAMEQQSASQHKDILNYVRDVVSSVRRINRNVEARRNELDTATIDHLLGDLSDSTNNVILSVNNFARSGNEESKEQVTASANSLCHAIAQLVHEVSLKQAPDSDMSESEHSAISNSMARAMEHPLSSSSPQASSPLSLHKSNTQNSLASPIRQPFESPRSLSQSSISAFSPVARTSSRLQAVPPTNGSLAGSPSTRQSDRSAYGEPIGLSINGSTSSSIRHSDRSVYGESIVLPPTDPLMELREHLEHNTEVVVDNIQRLLQAVRQESSRADTAKHVEAIVAAVHDSAQSSDAAIEASAAANSLPKAGPLLQSMLGSCTKLQHIIEENDEENLHRRDVKQLMAGVAFDCAKQTKDLLRLIEGITT